MWEEWVSRGKDGLARGTEGWAYQRRRIATHQPNEGLQNHQAAESTDVHLKSNRANGVLQVAPVPDTPAGTHYGFAWLLEPLCQMDAFVVRVIVPWAMPRLNKELVRGRHLRDAHHELVQTVGTINACSAVAPVTSPAFWSIH